ncbi:uncharacterized protein LOC103509275 [Diaphorina citri]|uniref:Uncharacterized protein LOC103509275 n=1 Tax=Diaphorina citri TaxID=121845 RepID=A0A1S3D2K3_DIACI|nr:uncharacterized protein LOC103509275 [Diaphorina citri]
MTMPDVIRGDYSTDISPPLESNPQPSDPNARQQEINPTIAESTTSGGNGSEVTCVTTHMRNLYHNMDHKIP